MKPTERRGKAAEENLKATVAGIFLNFLYSFVSRRVMVFSMGEEYVGLGSLIGNIAVLLTLLDFGASSAVIYRLYRPLADGDEKSISSLLCYYRRLCRLSAFLTCAAGLLYFPYAPRAAVGFSDVKLLQIVYLLRLFPMSIGYLFSPYRVLLFADQKNYVSQWFSYLFGGFCVLAESVGLLFFHNYPLALSCHTVLSLTEELVLRRYVKKHYPEIDFSKKTSVSPSLRRSLRQEILALQPTGIAGTLLCTVDNFLVVRLFGVAGNGLYSNYNMLLGYAVLFSVTLIGALSASVGNLGASEQPEKARRIFSVTCLAAFFPINIAATILCVLSGEIMTVWLGNGSLLPPWVSVALTVHFLIRALRQSTLIFRDAYGLYRRERIKPFVELILSVLFSFFLGKRLGLGGVYIGQALAAFIACFFYEPYVLFRYGFHAPVFPYYRVLFRFLTVSGFSCLCSFALCRFLPSFSLRFAACIGLSVLFFFGGFFGTETLSLLMKRFVSPRFSSVQKLQRKKSAVCQKPIVSQKKYV